MEAKLAIATRVNVGSPIALGYGFQCSLEPVPVGSHGGEFAFELAGDMDADHAVNPARAIIGKPCGCIRPRCVTHLIFPFTLFQYASPAFRLHPLGPQCHTLAMRSGPALGQ